MKEYELSWYDSETCTGEQGIKLRANGKWLTREDLVRWIHRLRTECISGYDWEWSSFEEGKTLDDIFGEGEG